MKLSVKNVKKALFKFIIIFFVVFFSKGICFSQTNLTLIKITGEKWPPYNNYVNNTSKPGFMFEIISHIFDENRYTFDYSERPWARAVMDTRDGKFHALIGPGKGDAPDFVFPSEAIGFTVNSFWVKKESPWIFEGMQSLPQVTVGGLLGMTYGEEIDKYIEINKKNNNLIDLISGQDYLRRNFVKLEKGRIDTVIDDLIVVKYFLKQTNQEDKFKSAGIVKNGYGIYLAFSPKYPNAKEMADMIGKGVKKLRESGKLKIILEKYGVTDWK
jgi:polar amino acid transport system substrate-binding protein